MNPLPVPPQNREAERALLGGIIRDPDALPDVLAVIRPDAMHFDAHRRVFAALVDLAGRDAPIDLVTVSTELQRRGHLEDVGGAPYLVELWEAVPTGANAVYHAKLVRDAFQLRGLIHAAHEILRDAYEPNGPAEELVAAAERKLFALSADIGADAEPRRVGEIARESLAAIDGRIAAGESLTGLSTGYPDLDQITGGLRSGELAVLGARPSVGKTAMALGIAEQAARSGVAVLFFSLEMPARDITDRLLSMRSGVPMSKMARAQELLPAHLDALFDVANGPNSALGAMPLYIEDSPTVTAARVAAVARRACRRFGVRLIVVDYLGLMVPENPRDNRNLQIGTLALRMKQMARSLNVPVILLSQLNREIEHANRKPRLADLRESGDIEAHADRVFLLHREPDQDTSKSVWPVELIVAKNRNGPIGDVALNYRRPVLRFENTAPAA